MKNIFLLVLLYFIPNFIVSQDVLGLSPKPIYTFKPCLAASDGTECAKTQLQSLIQKGLVSRLDANLLDGKRNARIKIKIDTTEKVSWSILYFKDDTGNHILKLKSNKLKLDDIIVNKIFYVDIKLDPSNPRMISQMRTEGPAVFKIVEEMPKTTYCKTENCINQWIKELIEKNLDFKKSDVAKLGPSKLFFNVIIEENGMVGDIQQTKTVPKEIQKIYFDAIEKSNLRSYEFTPAFQRGSPASVQISFASDFTP